MSDVPIAAAQVLQEGESSPATPDNVFPANIKANGRELSVVEHYRIARMSIGEVRRRYSVRDAEGFVARVKAAIRFWDGVEL